MSQIYKTQSGGPIPPGLVATLTGDTGINPVGPDGLNNINIFGENGIVTRGDAPSNTVFIGLEEPLICNTGSTVGGTTLDLVTIPLGAAAATYTFDANLAGKALTADGIGGNAFGTFRTNGAAATVINTVDIVENKDVAIAAATFDLVASGNNVVLRVMGAAGATITWHGCVSNVSAIAGV